MFRPRRKADLRLPARAYRLARRTATAMIRHHQACIRAILDRLWKHRSIGQTRLPTRVATVAALTIGPVGYADWGRFTM
jgi:hypothetical protein